MHLSPQYPTFPEFVAASQVVIEKVRKGDEGPSNAEAAQGGWIVLGYAASLGFSVLAQDGPGAALSEEELCVQLEDASRTSAQTSAADAAKAVPWGAIVLALVQLLIAWHKK